MPVTPTFPATETEQAILDAMLNNAEAVLTSLPPEDLEDLYVIALLLDPHTTMFGGVALQANTCRNWKSQKEAKQLTDLQAKWLYTEWPEMRMNYPVTTQIFDGWGVHQKLRQTWQQEQEAQGHGYQQQLERFWGLAVYASLELRKASCIPDFIRHSLVMVLDDNHTYDEEVLEATALANPDGQAHEWLKTPLPVICCQGSLDTRVGIIR